MICIDVSPFPHCLPTVQKAHLFNICTPRIMSVHAPTPSTRISVRRTSLPSVLALPTGTLSKHFEVFIDDEGDGARLCPIEVSRYRACKYGSTRASQRRLTLVTYFYCRILPWVGGRGSRAVLVPAILTYSLRFIRNSRVPVVWLQQSDFPEKQPLAAQPN